MSEIISLKDVSFAYEGQDPPALSGLSLEIARGEFVAVLGHNGSGKSSMAKLLNALLLPSAGTVWVLGMDTKDEAHTWDIRQHVGMVFQNPDNQLVATIVEEDVAFGPENLGVPQPEIRKRVDEALLAVHMQDFQLAAPHLLSGGQKQRIAIAGVLAMLPDVIVLDEATAMLDPSGRKEVLETVSALHRDRGITVVWITHEMDEAAKAQRILVMQEGGIVLSGTPREVFSQVEKMRALGLDVPPMTDMAYRLREAGFNLRDDILEIPEMVEALCQLR